MSHLHYLIGLFFGFALGFLIRPTWDELRQFKKDRKEDGDENDSK